MSGPSERSCRRGSLRAMRRAAVLLGILATVAVLAACGGGTPPESDAPAALPADAAPAAEEPAALPPVVAAEPPVEVEAPLLRQGHDGSCFPDVDAEPCTSGVEVGSQWTFEIYTHCGVEWIYFDGRFWLTEPLGKANAPKGWG